MPHRVVEQVGNQPLREPAVAVIAASAGVRKAQAAVLGSLYGVGTDVTVTGKPPAFKAPTPGGAPPPGSTIFQAGPGGLRLCQNGKCHNAAGQRIERLASDGYAPISQSKVTEPPG